jgi:hypothetical protein
MERSSEGDERGPRLEPLGADFLIPVLAAALTAYFFITTLDLAWEAKVTGTFIGAVLLALCVTHFARLGLRIASGRGSIGFGELFSDTQFNRQRLALLVLAILFIATIQWLGTTLGLFLLLVASMWVMGVRSLRVLFGVSFLTAAVVYLLLIYLLGSRLPQGVIENVLSAMWGAG